MTVSNGEDVQLPSIPKAHNKTEPGYYADGEYGIRIESVVVVREVQTPNNFGNKGFLGFERVTMARPV
jgi:Xaa-Pro aminopeptidase